jgi:hypothetical protein
MSVPLAEVVETYLSYSASTVDAEGAGVMTYAERLNLNRGGNSSVAGAGSRGTVVAGVDDVGPR